MDFKEYLKSNGYSDGTVREYTTVLSNIEKRLQIPPLGIKILNIKNPKELQDLKSKLEIMPEYIKYDKNRKDILSAALKQYTEYLYYINFSLFSDEEENINKEANIMTFKEYLKNIMKLEDTTVQRYINELRNVEKRFGVHLQKPILEIKDSEEFEKIKKELESYPQYDYVKDKTGRALPAALSNYSEYLEYISKNKQTDNKNIPDIDFSYSSFPDQNDFSRRYIKALLAKPFVILTGNSGTGKTRIALRFAEWLEKDNNCLIVPVGADWTDNTKMLGYFNPIAHDGKGEYVRSKVLDFILLAKQHLDIPFFLILDEMNLSHVERYFSDFLSAMESGKPILLYKKPEGCTDETPEEINLPDNLFVTGTVNIDETTYMFSPKVLDRANVIEFKPDMNSVMAILTGNNANEPIAKAQDGMAQGFLKLSKELKQGNNLIESETDRVKEILTDIYQKLESCGFEFAYRTVKEISLYLKAAKRLDEKFNTTTATDEQVLQKILPKLHGNKKQIGKLLEELKELFEENKMNLPLSKKKIESMIDRLDKFQYASYIQ